MPHAMPPQPPSDSALVEEHKEDETETMNDVLARYAPQLASQAEARKANVKAHKATRMEFRCAAEAIAADTPDKPESLPSHDELNALANLEDSDECESMASAVMGSSDVPPDLRPESSLEAGMAALKAQRAARKAALREHKRTSASAKVVRARTMRHSRKALESDAAVAEAED